MQSETSQHSTAGRKPKQGEQGSQLQQRHGQIGPSNENMHSNIHKAAKPATFP